MENSLAKPNDTLNVAVWRGDETGGNLVSYEVPSRASQSVLDVVTWIQRHLEPRLSYRFACRVGMCGSCAMRINGIPRWSCRTHVQTVLRNHSLTIEPLQNLPVIKDLATDMSSFFDKWTKAKGYFEPTATRYDDMAPIRPDTPERVAASAAIECINCAICYAACDTVRWSADYLGPAALGRAWSLVNDSRDGAYSARLKAVSGAGGCHNCHSHQSCTTYCPNELNPTASIAGLKRATAKALIKGEL